MTEEKCGLGEGTHFLGCECHERIFNEAIDLLCEMVGQHCYLDGSKFDVESGCLSANANAMRFLGKIGKLKLDDRGMRVVFGNWPKEEE